MTGLLLTDKEMDDLCPTKEEQAAFLAEPTPPDEFNQYLERTLPLEVKQSVAFDAVHCRKVAEAQHAKDLKHPSKKDRPELRKAISLLKFTTHGLILDQGENRLVATLTKEDIDQLVLLYPDEEAIKTAGAKEERERVVAIYTRYHDVLSPRELKKAMLEKGE